MPKMAPMVTTPVPPTPVTRIPAGLGANIPDKGTRKSGKILLLFDHKLVDNHATVRVQYLSLLAAAALFRRASLIVNEHGYAGNRGKLALRAVELATVLDGQPLRPLRGGRIFVRLVGDDDDAPYVFGGNLTRDHFDGEAALKALTTGHRHGVVEQYLESDVDAGSDGEAER